jgi:hypothetical protein
MFQVKPKKLGQGVGNSCSLGACCLNAYIEKQQKYPYSANVIIWKIV